MLQLGSAHGKDHDPTAPARERAATPSIRSVPALEILVAIGCSALAGAVLLALRALDQTGDSLAYAWAARTGKELFHPHHLFFSVVGHLLHRGLTWSGFTSDTILAMQFHNVAWACAALTGMYLLGRAAGWTRRTAVLASGLLLSCNGFLEYTTQTEVYVPAVACLILLVLRLLHRTRSNLTTIGALELSLWWTLAIGYHQTNVLFVVPLAAFAWTLRRRSDGGRYLVVLLCTGALCLTAYVVAFWTEPVKHDVVGFVRFCLRYAVSHVPSWGDNANVSPLGIARLLKAQLSVIASLSAGRSLLLAGTAASFGLALLVLMAYGRRLAIQRPDGRALLTLALMWLVAYFAFFLWWLPGEKEFYIATLVPLILVLCALVESAGDGTGRAKRQSALALVAIVLLAHGLRATVLPLHRSRGVTYARAADIASSAGQECAITTGNPEIQALRYYFDIEGATELLMPLVMVLATETLPSTPLRSSGRCLLLDINDLRPDRLTEPNGFDHPREWFRFVSWVLEASPADSVGRFTALSMKHVSASSRTSIVSLPGTFERYASWSELFARLDSLDIYGPGSGRRVFDKWATTNSTRP